MEVLVALGIFAVGLVAVAAVFPTAISVQSETVRDLAGQRAVVNARTMIQSLARSADSNETEPPTNFLSLTYKHDINPLLRTGTLVPFTEVPPTPTSWTGFPGGVQPMLDQPLPPVGVQRTLSPTAEMTNPALNAAKSFHSLFSQDIRSYPYSIIQSDRRDYYWFPMIQIRDLTQQNSASWMMYLMVMQRRGTDAVPQVRAARIDPAQSSGRIIALATTGPNATEIWDNDFDDDGLPDILQPGDWVLDSRGTIHRVLLAERNQFTVESPVPINFRNGDLIYFAVAVEGGGNWQTPVIKRETRSPIVRIEQFEIVVDQP